MNRARVINRYTIPDPAETSDSESDTDPELSFNQIGYQTTVDLEKAKYLYKDLSDTNISLDELNPATKPFEMEIEQLVELRYELYDGYTHELEFSETVKTKESLAFSNELLRNIMSVKEMNAKITDIKRKGAITELTLKRARRGIIEEIESHERKGKILGPRYINFNSYTEQAPLVEDEETETRYRFGKPKRKLTNIGAVNTLAGSFRRSRLENDEDI